MSRHEPVRPTWRCAACDGEWPCLRRRDEYVREYGGSRVMLSLAMARHYGDAVEDLARVPASALYVRFLGWFATRAR